MALSCGGLVRRMTARGNPVTVATVCTADRPTGQPLSEAARHVHGEWQLGDAHPYRLRRREDEAACATLGATPLHLGLLDAIYRVADDGEALYTRNFIGGEVHEHDWQHHFSRVKATLHEPIRGARRIYCPLGIGGHVDHVVVRQAVEALTELGQVIYYEDFPYADKANWQDSDVTAGLVPAQFVPAETEIAARIGAIACYPSQQYALFERPERMPGRVRNYIARAGGERYWSPLDAYRDSD